MSAARTKKKRQRTHRYTSNVFSMFNQAQIQEFKEAFNMIDQNRDGFVDRDDLIEMLTSLGKNPDDQYLDGMINEAPGPINFTMFLTLFGEKLNGTDPEEVISNAFGCFDLTNKGIIPEDRLREIMTTMGDRWTDDKVDELFHGAPIRDGLFDYVEFTRTLKHGAKDKDEDAPPPTPTSAPPTPNQKTPPTPNAFKPKVPISPKPQVPLSSKQPVNSVPKQQQQAPPTSKGPPSSAPKLQAPPVPKPRGPHAPEANHHKPNDVPPSLPKTAPPKHPHKPPNLPTSPPPGAPSKAPFGAALKSTTGKPALKKF